MPPPRALVLQPHFVGFFGIVGSGWFGAMLVTSAPPLPVPGVDAVGQVSQACQATVDFGEGEWDEAL